MNSGNRRESSNKTFLSFSVEAILSEPKYKKFKASTGINTVPDISCQRYYPIMQIEFDHYKPKLLVESGSE